MDMTQCIRVCRDCADICAATSRLAVRRAGQNVEALRLKLETCARICDLCAEECERHDHGHCKLCAGMCRECAADCRAAQPTVNGMAVTGWKVETEDRERLLARFAPRWPDVIADHVTLDAKANSRTPLPEQVSAEIVGEADDGAALQAMVIAIDGTTERPDGSTYHITWSLYGVKGRKPVQSNDVIRERCWCRFDEAVSVQLKARIAS